MKFLYLLFVLAAAVPAQDKPTAITLPKEFANALGETVSKMAAAGEKGRLCAVQVGVYQTQIRDIASRRTAATNQAISIQESLNTANAKIGELKHGPRTLDTQRQYNETDGQADALKAQLKHLVDMIQRLNEEETSYNNDLRDRQKCVASTGLAVMSLITPASTPPAGEKGDGPKEK